MRILLTGSSGFIGSSLRDFLEKKRVRVIAYDLKDSPSNDVRDFSNLKSKMKDVNGVVHLAAVSRVKWGFENPLNCIQTNVGGTINVLVAVRTFLRNKKPWMIFASSREVFGEPKILPVTEKSPLCPVNVYGVAKVTGEELCRVFSKDYGLKTRVLRFSNVYTGKNDQLDRVVPNFILRALRNEDLVINGNGQETFDFTFIEDTILGIWGCIQKIESSGKLYDDFNLSNGKGITLEELAKIIIKETGSQSKIRYAPSRSYDVNYFYADSSKARTVLGFNPRTELREGIYLAIKEFHGR